MYKRQDHGSIENGGEVRIALQNSAGNDLWTFVFVGGEGHYRLNGSATAIPYTDASIAIALTPVSYTHLALSGHLEPIPLRSGAGSSEDWFIYRTADHYTWERGLVPPEGDAVLIA